MVKDLGKPKEFAEAGLGGVFDEHIKMLEARVVAFGELRDAQAAAGRQQRAIAAAGRMKAASTALEAWGERRECMADDYASQLANLGAAADLRFEMMGLSAPAGQGAGPAAARRASMVSTRLALASVVGPLQERCNDLKLARETVRAVTGPRSGQARIDTLRSDASSAVGFYDGVHAALERTLSDVLTRRDELAAVGDSFLPS